ncbi:hypothetical protein GGR21_002814 [Dysgonomonas hofstadii]|uniref:DUF4377 domain-containing protein n=1 Tax=Dysgonomonas hofstadii TaxID=637886 RepID=A0A840CLN4_9BACT|nr:DUF4377 domain-containing protein [Dysgonomonas hofstadii]MBB4036900.1 hypothetical protein [Dysgonomonas hofstadii]
MKRLFFLLFLVPFICGGLVSCSDDDTKVFDVTISSVKKVYDGSYVFSPYFAKQEGDNTWKPFGYIEGFEHEEGYEYMLKVRQEKVHDGEIADAPTHKQILLEVLSKTKKESENIPIQGAHALIASKRPQNTATPSYYIKIMKDWEVYEGEIEGFEYEEGYEYRVYLGLTFMGHEADPKYSYSIIDSFKKEQKDSEGLPVD